MTSVNFENTLINPNSSLLSLWKIYLLSFSMGLPLLGISSKWNHMWPLVPDLFSILVFEVHSYYTSEKAMAPHSSTLAWKIPWAEEPGVERGGPCPPRRLKGSSLFRPEGRNGPWQPSCDPHKSPDTPGSLEGEWLVDTVVQVEGGTNWESSIDIFTTIMCKTDSHWEFAI